MNSFAQFLFPPAGGGPPLPEVDVSLIAVRANAALVGFGTYTDAPTLPFNAIEINNATGYAIILTQVNYSVAVAGITATTQNYQLGQIRLDLVVTNTPPIGSLNAAGWKEIQSLILADNGTYNGVLTCESMAGFAFVWPANGLSSNINYATFSAGVTMLQWKKTTNLSIPFSGTIDYQS